MQVDAEPVAVPSTVAPERKVRLVRSVQRFALCLCSKMETNPKLRHLNQKKVFTLLCKKDQHNHRTNHGCPVGPRTTLNIFGVPPRHIPKKNFPSVKTSI